MSINRIAYLLENDPIEARALLLETLERCENRRVRAARIFGVSTRTLGRWLIKAGFERDPGGPRTSRKATS
jgi:DNA-binding NtrC family response regulator